MSVFEELDATVIKPAPGSRAMLGVVASVVFPGLGHLIVGRKKRAAVFFVIDAVIIVATIWLLSLGTIGLLQLLVQPRWVRAVVVGNVALGLFRLIAAADLVALERPKVNRFLTAGMAAVLTVVLVGPHMFVMTRALSLLDVLENVFPPKDTSPRRSSGTRLRLRRDRCRFGGTEHDDHRYDCSSAISRRARRHSGAALW